MHLTLIQGGRKHAATHAPASFSENDSRRHPNPMVRDLVASVRESLPAERKRLNAHDRAIIAAGRALATLDYLCTPLAETSSMAGPRGLIARSLAKIIVQLEGGEVNP